MSGALVKYNAARTALSEAHAVDEVKDIRDKAEAMAAYARQAKDTELLKWVTEIKVRAERRAGQMLAEMPKATGTQLNGKNIGGHIVVPPKNDAKTLSELGITKNESSRWQKLAGVSDEKFEHAVAAAKEVAGEVTTAAMLRVAEPPKPVVEPAYNPADDEAEEMKEAVRTIAAENDVLRVRLAMDANGATDEEKAFAFENMEAKDARIRALEAEVYALRASRDKYQRDNADMKSQLASQRKLIAKLQKVEA